MDMDWKVEFAASAERELARLPGKVKIKALESIQLLRFDPIRRGVKKLAANDYYSICLFSDQRLVLITRVRHRSDAIVDSESALMK